MRDFGEVAVYLLPITLHSISAVGLERLEAKTHEAEAKPPEAEAKTHEAEATTHEAEARFFGLTFLVITPIFKKGDPFDVSNYRPIAMTCICCKLLKSIVVPDSLQYLNNHNLINKYQHGFLRKHSCLTNLLESCRDWTVSLSNHKSVGIDSIDFQKAFDTVSHSKLVYKLIGYGIQGNYFHGFPRFCQIEQIANRDVIL